MDKIVPIVSDESKNPPSILDNKFWEKVLSIRKKLAE